MNGEEVRTIDVVQERSEGLEDEIARGVFAWSLLPVTGMLKRAGDIVVDRD